MDYIYSPSVGNLSGVMAPMNPASAVFVSEALRYGPTQVIADPSAGIMVDPRYGLSGWRDAMDVFTAIDFLFPA